MKDIEFPLELFPPRYTLSPPPQSQLRSAQGLPKFVSDYVNVNVMYKCPNSPAMSYPSLDLLTSVWPQALGLPTEPFLQMAQVELKGDTSNAQDMS